MKKSWGLLEKIGSGEKKAESRWYKNKTIPWDKVKVGDNIWFKNSSEPVTLKAQVFKVLQFSDLNPKKTNYILRKYGKSDIGLENHIPKEISNYINNKKYCILVFLGNVKKIKPFNIDKKGFGAMSAWICVEDINLIKSN